MGYVSGVGSATSMNINDDLGNGIRYGMTDNEPLFKLSGGSTTFSKTAGFSSPDLARGKIKFWFILAASSNISLTKSELTSFYLSSSL